MMWRIFKQTLTQWLDDKAPEMGAALAFYSLLSLGPLLLIAVSVAGLWFGPEAASGQIVSQIEGLTGRDGAEAIQTMLAQSREPSKGILATILGLVTLFIGASAVFVQLQDALNTIWKTPPLPGGTLLTTLRRRLLSFTMVLGIGFLLLVSLLLSAILTAINTYFTGLMPGWSTVLQLVNNAVGFGVTTLLFAMIFKILPDVRINWRDVWQGALLSAGLFTLGKYLIGLYLGSSGVASTYGAAGSFIVLMLWVYYSAQILFFGAELTYVLTKKFGASEAPDAADSPPRSSPASHQTAAKPSHRA